MTLDETKSALRARGFTLSQWCLSHGYHGQTVRLALQGSVRGSPLRDRIMRDLEKTLAMPVDGPLPHETRRVE